MEHRFEVPVGIEKAFATLADMEQVGGCFPGATVDKVDGAEFSGTVKIKLGPIRLTYKGHGTIVEKDPIAHRARIEATGNAGGSSTAAMLVSATATALAPNRTAVDLVTTLSITGRPAQFGRGVMVEVSNKMISQFADCVSTKLVGKEAGGAELVDVVDPDEVAAEVVADEREAVQEAQAAQAAQDRPAAPAPVQAHRVPTAEPEPIDLLGTAGVPVLRRVVPVLAGVVGLILISKLVRRRKTQPEE
nr:SRPBCC family protein [Nakamurella flavida]